MWEKKLLGFTPYKAKKPLERAELQAKQEKQDEMSWVYSRTNWTPFPGGQNSILNWVLELNLLKKKIKK